ncbi:hypothetical protein I4U23_030628 [Adineta vaga]|nr:hypothetical protein I4U23_030628 [Adineta vaga]
MIPSLIEEQHSLHDHNHDDILLISPSTTITEESIVEDLVNAIIDSNTTTTTTTTMATTLTDQEPTNQFVTEYSLNVNLSSLSFSDLTLNTYFNDSILLILEEHEIVLINKHNGTIHNHYKHAMIIPINQPNTLVIFDDNSQEISILNSTHQQKLFISFKPKRIHVFSSTNHLWFAETSDQIALYFSSNFGIDWNKLDDTASSTILGWSYKTNSLVILQHTRNIKLLDMATYKTQTILNDVPIAKLFSRYLLAKRLNSNDPISISHIDNLGDDGFQVLPKRLQSQGNFYCAIEDIYTQDLLLLFTTVNKFEETNGTLSTTCNLIGYSKGNLFNLSNIECELNNNDSPPNTIECSSKQVSLYQIHGLSRNVFLANIASEPTTVISFDNGINWNKTHYECDKMIDCPTNASIVLNSLVSSNEAPGIIVGKATNGLNNYVAISSDGGQVWRLSSKGQNNVSAISNPNALIITVPDNDQHSFQYSTDYGRNWHEKTFLNETSFQILSLLADSNNIFYILTINTTNSFNLIQFNFNTLVPDQCARHQLKEWSLQGNCINGTKSYYKRRISGSQCLNNATDIRIQSCACSLSDFQCLPGYRRSLDGICLPKSHFIISQDCSCNENNNTLLTKRRGYAKSIDNQCQHGIENYLADTFVTRHSPSERSFFIYGVNAETKQSIVEIHSNDFDQNDDDDEDLIRNPLWSMDQRYEITALAFDENSKLIYMAVQYDRTASIYRIDQNLYQSNRWKNELIFDPNNELYKNLDGKIEYLTIDSLTQNLYVLVRNQITFQQNIFILNIRTQKQRTIVKNQHIQPAILLLDPIKTNLYWISHNSPSIFHIANLQGQMKKQIQLFPDNSTISYMSYDPITYEVIFVVNSTIYGLNTLDHRRLIPRIIYEHSSNIHNALFVYPILYFTNEIHNKTETTMIDLHAIDILARSYAKNMTKLKSFDSLKLFVDMTPAVAKSTIRTINPCASNLCSDICIPLENEGFRCLCSDNAQYHSCSCPINERFAAGTCQTVNNQCALGRVLCQNRINCAESAVLCERDHTQYTESFKNMTRCTIEKADDGFDCYYHDKQTSNSRCIPFEWLCDGVDDCPLGNDEEHCHKMTTNIESIEKIPNRCLTEKKFTHVMCQNECLKIDNLCRNISNKFDCPNEFYLHCHKMPEENEYTCKCHDQNRCIAMTEECNDSKHCDAVCRNAIYEFNSKTNPFLKPASMTWMILLTSILLLLFVAIFLMTLRYRRRRRAAKQTATSSRTPAEPTVANTTSPPSDTREKLLDTNANETN